MWSYYGRKSKLVHLYPEPKHDTIIEPFAGTAVYSLHGDNWKRNVIIRDVNPQVIRLWKWLQFHATPELIRCLPDMEEGERIRDDFPTEARWLTMFFSNQGNVKAANVAGRMGFCKWSTQRETIASNIHKIRHWDIQLGDYRNIPNIKATWFVDPPYVNGGDRYAYCEPIDYSELGAWCKSRRGQLIVCEADGAEWLNFVPLTEFTGQRTKRTELVYIR